jgi:hypothetical protein
MFLCLIIYVNVIYYMFYFTLVTWYYILFLFIWDMLDLVWEHGEKVGTYFKCKYFRETKNAEGGTRLKEHITHRQNGRILGSFPYDWVVWLELTWVLWNMSTYVSWKNSKRTCIWVLWSPTIVCFMIIEVCGCICILYNILVNISCMDRLVFTMQRELNKL